LIEDAAQALHTTAAMRFGRSTALSQIAFATLRQLCIAANVVRKSLASLASRSAAFPHNGRRFPQLCLPLASRATSHNYGISSILQKLCY